MIYLASPYSSPDPLIMKTRFLLAEQVTAKLLIEGYHVYSPIVHCHELAQKYTLPTDFTFWKSYNFAMLRRADRMFILAIDGWAESKGVTAETDFALEAGIEVNYIDENGAMISREGAWQ